MQEEIKESALPPEEEAVIESAPNELVYTSDAEKKGFLGPVIGILVIVLVLILAGIYIWGASLSREANLQNPIPRAIENNEPETSRAEADAQIFSTVSTSDEIDAIDADIESTNLDSLDAELEEIDRELDTALDSF